MYIIMCIVQLKGNDVATVLDSGDRLGRTPLHYAASQKTGPNRFQFHIRAKFISGDMCLFLTCFMLIDLYPSQVSRTSRTC